MKSPILAAIAAASNDELKEIASRMVPRIHAVNYEEKPEDLWKAEHDAMMLVYDLAGRP